MLKIELSNELYNEVASCFVPSATVYFVGGCVRDALLGIYPKEFDFEVHDIAPSEFEQAMQKLGASGVGKSFFVYKYKNCDISLPRKERKIGTGHAGFEVSLETDVKNACMRRDFTINAMMYNPKTNEIIDFFGGMQDLQNKILRAVNKETFAEDSLRVLRACQFAARLGFRIDNDTVFLCNSLDLSDLSLQRVWLELEKLFYAQNKHIGLYYFFKLGIAQKIFGITDDSHLFNAMRFLLKIKHQNRLAIAYVVRQFWGVSILEFAPNEWKREFALQIKRPKKITQRFLAALSLRLAPKEWLGGNFSGEKTDFGINAKVVMAQGFVGKDISKQIKFERKLAIMAKYDKC